MEIKLHRTNRVYHASISAPQPEFRREGVFANPAEAVAAIVRWKKQIGPN